MNTIKTERLDGIRRPGMIKNAFWTARLMAASGVLKVGRVVTGETGQLDSVLGKVYCSRGTINFLCGNFERAAYWFAKAQQYSSGQYAKFYARYAACALAKLAVSYETLLVRQEKLIRINETEGITPLVSERCYSAGTAFQAAEYRTKAGKKFEEAGMRIHSSRQYKFGYQNCELACDLLELAGRSDGIIKFVPFQEHITVKMVHGLKDYLETKISESSK